MIVLGMLGGKKKSTLLNGLLAYWTFEDVWTDANGSNTLVPQAGDAAPTFATGKVGKAAAFDSSKSQYASIIDNAALSVADIDFSFDFWINATDHNGATNYGIFGKGTNMTLASQFAYYCYFSKTGLLYWVVSYSSGSDYVVTTSILTAGTPYYCYMYHDSVNNEIGLSINNGTPIVKPYSSGCYDEGGSFFLGSAPGGSLNLNGLVDELGFRKRLLTATEVAARYNGGAGNTYPFSSGSGTAYVANYGTFIYSSTIGT